MTKPRSKDPVEEVIADALDAAGIPFDRDVPVGLRTIDFHIPKHGFYIEVCRCHTPRKIQQLDGVENVILIQGLHAALAFASLIKNKEPGE